MESQFSSVTLNENSFFFGLNLNDLITISATLIICQKVGLGELAKILPVLVSLGVAVLLIPIRMRFRRKIIRDFITFWSEYAFQQFLIRL
jgi:hypothetical protein